MAYTDDALQDLIDNEIYACQSSLVEMLLRKEIVSYDEIKDLYVYPDWEHGEYSFDGVTKAEYDCYVDLLNSELEELQDYDELDEDLIADLEEAVESLAKLESKPVEVYEWYLVSHHLASKLNAPILCAFNCTWWGRCTTRMRITPDELKGVLCD
jgi:hypothetical protein